MASTRFPGKILKTLPYKSNITVLQQVIRRLKRSKKLDTIIVATTVKKEDGAIVKIAKKENVKYFRGSMNDLLERYYLAARQNNLDVVVRVTSDCPCVDPLIVDTLIESHIKTKADYTTSAIYKNKILKETYPCGLSVEVIKFNALKKAKNQARQEFEKEHVCPYIYKTRPEVFKINSVRTPRNLTAPEIRITLDTEEDYALLCAIFDNLYYKNKYFKTSDIINLFKEKPWLRLINQKIVHKKASYTLREEINEGMRLLELQGLKRAKSILKSYSRK